MGKGGWERGGKGGWGGEGGQERGGWEWGEEGGAKGEGTSSNACPKEGTGCSSLLSHLIILMSSIDGIKFFDVFVFPLCFLSAWEETLVIAQAATVPAVTVHSDDIVK